MFVDTNVLLYAWDASLPEKQRQAVEWMERLWRERAGRLSFQVLTEFYVTATRKLRPPLAAATAQGYVRTLLAWEPVVTNGETLAAAWTTQGRYPLSWWDSLIVAAAQRAACRLLLTEDLQDGQQFGDLTVLNPFRPAPR